MTCINGDGHPVENSDTGLCSSCGRLARKANAIQPSDNHTVIDKRSAKGKDVDKKYLARLRTWKRWKKCAAHFVHDCSNHIECHHRFGRSDNAFHDEEAEQAGIVLTLDERWWLPLCHNAHRYITDNPKFAHEHGYSYLRLAETIKL